MFTFQDVTYSTSDSYEMQPADFNGDGFADFYRVHDGNLYVYLFNPDTKQFEKTYASPYGPLEDIRLVDFNGDGLVDMYKATSWDIFQVHSIDTLLLMNNGDGTFKKQDIGKRRDHP